MTTAAPAVRIALVKPETPPAAGETIGQRLKRLRLERGLSQRELANLVGGTRESMNKYLGEWKRDAVIAIEDGKIRVLDRSALEVIAEGE